MRQIAQQLQTMKVGTYRKTGFFLLLYRYDWAQDNLAGPFL